MSNDEVTRKLERMIAEEKARIDLSAPVTAICERLGLDPNQVGRIDIHPATVTAEVYLERDGKKYITDDGNAAIERRSFKVRTWRPAIEQRKDVA